MAIAIQMHVWIARRRQAPVPGVLCVVGWSVVCINSYMRVPIINLCAHTSKPHARRAQARYLVSMEPAKSELQVAVLAEVDAQHHQTSDRLWTQAVPELPVISCCWMVVLIWRWQQ